MSLLGDTPGGHVRSPRQTLALLELLLQKTPHAVDTAKQLCNCSFWKSLESKNTKYAARLRVVTFSLCDIWQNTFLLVVQENSMQTKQWKLRKTVVIQLLAKAAIFKCYRAMAINTQGLIKFCHYLYDNIWLSHLLWMSPPVQSMGVAKDSERGNVSWGKWMKMCHTTGQRSTFLSSFLVPVTSTGLKQWPLRKRHLQHLWWLYIQHLYRGTKKVERRMAKRWKHIERF